MQQRHFPSVGGLFAGGLILVMSLIAQPDDASWVTVRDLFITFSVVFTAVNAVGLLELRRRQREASEVVNKEAI
jgi:phosphotransferase system  glucose/maltose/N-acetylglucosamine-specific IIC component